MGLRSVSYPTAATQLLRLYGQPLQHCRHDGRQRRNRSCIAMEAALTLCSIRVVGRFYANYLAYNLLRPDDYTQIPPGNDLQSYPLTLIRRPRSPSRSSAISTSRSRKRRGNFSPHSISRMLLSERRSSSPSVSNWRGVSMRYRSMW
jgi:hypothetical protein